MLEELIQYLERAGMSREDLNIQEVEETKIVSFSQVTQSHKPLSVSVAFHGDTEQAELYVLCKTAMQEGLELLQKVNQLNVDYTGLTFFVEGGMVALKTVSEGDYSAEAVVQKLIVALSVADAEFDSM